MSGRRISGAGSIPSYVTLSFASLLARRFNIRQDYTPEEVEEVKRAHPWIYGAQPYYAVSACLLGS